MKVEDGTISRRGFVAAGAALSFGAAHLESRLVESAPRVRVTGFDLLPGRVAPERTEETREIRRLLELTRIAAVAEAEGVDVAPHNPSGPISTAASIHACAVLPNFRILELQWGEVAWRGDLVTPPERFVQGTIAVPERPGFGIDLNEKSVRAHAM